MEVKIRERELQAWELRKRGMTYRQIGEILGVSSPRARQIVRIAQAKLEWAEKEGPLIYQKFPLTQISKIHPTTRHAFMERGFATLEEIASRTYKELVALGLSEGSIKRIVVVLENYGLKLKGWKDHEEMIAAVDRKVAEFFEWLTQAQKELGEDGMHLLRRKLRHILKPGVLPKSAGDAG